MQYACGRLPQDTRTSSLHLGPQDQWASSRRRDSAKLRVVREGPLSARTCTGGALVWLCTQFTDGDSTDAYVESVLLATHPTPRVCCGLPTACTRRLKTQFREFSFAHFSPPRLHTTRATAGHDFDQAALTFLGVVLMLCRHHVVFRW